jgi:uncharacterized protein (DUF2164 family)
MKNMKKRKYELTKEKRNEMIEKIKEYYYNEREEEIGDLAASLLLNFIIDELADDFYNQGVNDCYKYFSDRTEDVLGLLR